MKRPQLLIALAAALGLALAAAGFFLGAWMNQRTEPAPPRLVEQPIDDRPPAPHPQPGDADYEEWLDRCGNASAVVNTACVYRDGGPVDAAACQRAHDVLADC